MSISSGNAACRLVVLDGIVERVTLLTECYRTESRVVCIYSNHTYLMIDSLFSILLSLLLICIDDAHRHTELEGVCESAPLHSCTVIYRVSVWRDCRKLVLSKGVDHLVKLCEHCVIYLLLRIVRYGDLTAHTDLSIRDRTVCICNSEHCSNLDGLCDCEGHRIVSDVLKLAEVRVECRDDPVAGHEYSCPVVSRIVVVDSLLPCSCRRVVTSHRTTEQTVGELCGVHVCRDDCSAEGSDRSTDGITVSEGLLLAHLIRVCVDGEVVAGTSHEHARENSRNSCLYDNVSHFSLLLEG